MLTNDVVEAIYRALCARQRAAGPEAAMSLTELLLACEITWAQLTEALYQIEMATDESPRIAFISRDHVTLGARWAARCADERGVN